MFTAMSHLFSTKISVQVNHLNYGNHLGYDAVLSILQEARLRWLKTLDQTCSEINIQNNIGWVVKQVNINYNSDAKYADDLLVRLYIDEYAKIKLCLRHEVINKTTNKNLCDGNILLVFFDFIRNKPVQMPEIISDFLN